jgi:lipopolysaccharide export system permease protein
MIPLTLSRYFAGRFLSAMTAVFGGVFLLVALLDYVESMRRASNAPQASVWAVAKLSFFRVPEITERLLPFAVLVAAMVCYLGLSRRNELVIVRSAGMSAWQFIAPAAATAMLLGAAAATIYNPISTMMREESKRLEAELSAQSGSSLRQSGGGFWVRQKTSEGQAIINAGSSRDQGVVLGGVTVFLFDSSEHFLQRIEAVTAELRPGYWRLEKPRIYASGTLTRDLDSYVLKTLLTPTQVRESFATPETVSFWQLPVYIRTTEQAGLVAAGYRVQYQSLLARPFLFLAMVGLAASASLRFLRSGGVSAAIVSGIAPGFLLYVLLKVTEDLGRAELMDPIAAAWLPAIVGGLTSFLVLLHKEDG